MLADLLDVPRAEQMAASKGDRWAASWEMRLAGQRDKTMAELWEISKAGCLAEQRVQRWAATLGAGLVARWATLMVVCWADQMAALWV